MTRPIRWVFGKLLDLIFGEEEEFNYVSKTTPPRHPHGGKRGF